jgi:hypothetical protein
MVLGGGHSIRERLDEIRQSTADKWAIGSAWRWFKDNGVECTFFCVDPSDLLIPHAQGVTRAILESGTSPGVFDAVQGEILLFDRVTDLDSINGVTTATCAPMLALKMGYTSVSFYGCEGSYRDQTHLYMNSGDPYTMRVRANGEYFLTGAEFLMQAEFLSELIRASDVFKDCSGGLLSALIADPDYDVTHISKTLHDSIGGHA